MPPTKFFVYANVKRAILILSAIILIPAVSASAQEKHTTGELVDKIMEASGFKHSLIDVWIGLEAGIEDEEQLPGEDLRKTRQILRTGFEGQRLVTLFTSKLTDRLEPEYAEAVLLFLQTDTGRRIVEAENRELNVTDDELHDYLETLETSRPEYRKRIEYVVNIIEETKAIENTVEILFSMYSNLLLAVNAVDEPDRRMSPQEFRETTQLIRMQLEHQMKQYVTMNLLYTFRELEQNHLETYVAHLRTPAGRWYTSALHEVLTDVLQNAQQQVQSELDAL